jgi:hypothetical protein
MDAKHTTVAIYETHQLAESAVMQLHESGLDMSTVSVIGQGYHSGDNVVGYYEKGDRMRAWGETGAFWGAIWGLLIGSAFFVIPGLGPLLFAGPIVAGLVGALEGAAVGGGLSVLGSALLKVGIPTEFAREYEAASRAHKYLLLVHGTAADAAKAKRILEQTDAAHSAVHAA